MEAVFDTHLPFSGRRQGKVRDIYELPPAKDGGSSPPRLLVIATDRISAFDVVMPTPIAGKGILLTGISSWWFRFIQERRLAPIHVLSTDPGTIPGLTADQVTMLRGRSMIARRCRIVPIECVVRGYLDGSGWVEYSKTGKDCGIALPPGLSRGDRLPNPIFTPATKEEVGVHDENIDFDRACSIAGAPVMHKLRDLSLRIYESAHQYAAGRGLILADTKFEFGFPLNADGAPASDEVMLADEVLTPDSSRYWDAKIWKPGSEQASFDKQFLREYLNDLVAKGKWNKQAPGPALPEAVVRGTIDRYQEARRRIIG